MKIVKNILLTVLCLIFFTWLIAFISLRFESHEYAPISAQQRDEATQYLAGKLTPAPPNWQWQRFQAAPGVVLRGGLIRHPNSKGMVIVVPGFTGSIEMIMREIVQIHNAGYSVATIEYRGQGESYRPLPNPEKGYIEDFLVLASEVAAFAESVREQNKPLMFYSISKGAHITMRMAVETDINVDAYALMVPMIKINTGELSYDSVRGLTKFLTAVGLGAMYAPGQSAYSPEQYGVATPCNANPETAQSQGAMFALNEKLRTRGSTIKWLYETFQSTDKLLNPKYTESIGQPVKIFTAGIDHLVSTEAALQFCSNLANCSVTHSDTARHCITREDFELYDALVDEAIVHFDRTSENY